MHVIGKLGVSESVLLKPGILDPAEWQLMQKHVEIGEQLLAPLRTMEPVRAIVRHHHERWDGTGYPDGLAGSEIPFLARVFQILDAYDALTHERPYRQPLSSEAALELLQQETAGGKWDPELVSAYVACKRNEGELGK